MADPLPFPVGIGGFSAVDLRIVRSIVRTPFRSGEMQRAEVGPPRWRIACTTSFPLLTHRADGWLAWLDSLQGGMRLFLGGDPSRARPIAHPTGIAGWNGAATVTGRGDFSIAFSGVPNALRLNPGDMLHMAKGVGGVLRVGLHRVTAAAAASDEAISVAVEPAVMKDVFTVDTAATFYNPRGLFMLDPDSVESGKSTDFPPISFSALQVL